MAQYRGSIGRVGHSNVQKAIMVINSHDLAIMFRGTAPKRTYQNLFWGPQEKSWH